MQQISLCELYVLYNIIIIIIIIISERELMFMFAICRRPSVCRLSSVCNVRAPYSAD